MRGLGSVLIAIAALAVTACANLVTTPTPHGPRSINLNGKTYSEAELGKFVSWRCKDFIRPSDTLVEVGVFTKDELATSGFILYEGGNSGALTQYHRQGLDRRWDWSSGGGNFSFVVNPDGAGRYYDFSSVPLGEKTKPRDIYKCSQETY